jgi:flagellar basal body-associated protein FliL
MPTDPEVRHHLARAALTERFEAITMNRRLGEMPARGRKVMDLPVIVFIVLTVVAVVAGVGFAVKSKQAEQEPEREADRPKDQG